MTLRFGDLLAGSGVASDTVQLMRHQPTEPRFAKALPGLRVTRPDLFSAYQEWQRPTLFKTKGIGTIASFVADGSGRALFAGLWKLDDVIAAGQADWEADVRNHELFALGMDDWTRRPRANRARYRTSALEELSALIGKLLVGWNTRGQSWSHRADRHDLPIIAIHEESAFDPPPAPWDQWVIGWAELETLPPRRRAQLAEWRGVYYIFDEVDRLGYVGAASGADNILGRWRNYAASGDGGNRQLRGRDPANFRFSILQRLSPDLPRDEVEAIERGWKRRLHTREHGLNAN